jgi:ribosomal protein S18 acetylase RimI-like enzyme
MLRVLAGERQDADVLVATQSGAIIGHAMAVDSAGPGGDAMAEIGVVVADAWQGRGVGSGLVRALAARARARGATAVVMEVMAENQRVLGMIAGG